MESSERDIERGTSELTTSFHSSVSVAWRIDGPAGRRTGDSDASRTGDSGPRRADGPDLSRDGDSGPTTPLVLCLHGWGMNEDWFSLLLQGLFDLPCRFLIPRATIPVERKNARDGEREGGSWYEYDGDQERFRAELARTEALFLSLVEDVERRFDWRPRARYLLGFSQGGYCGSVAALRHPEIFDGIIVSGARVKTELLEKEIRAAGRSGFSALLLHGLRDDAVRLDAAERSRDGLARGGVDVRLETFDAGHSLGRVQVAAIREWLHPRLLERTS